MKLVPSKDVQVQRLQNKQWNGNETGAVKYVKLEDGVKWTQDPYCRDISAGWLVTGSLWYWIYLYGRFRISVPGIWYNYV